jgi:hypothetical protein
MLKSALLGTALALIASAAMARAPATDAPKAAVIDEARTLVDAMRASPKGPYSNIQWVCKDGTVLPPRPSACAPHGGGNQFAKFSAQRDRLATLGYPVGTIFQNFDSGSAGPDARAFTRLRDLPLESYMIAVDDGWVLRGARSYRGRVQIEDEEVAGRDLLLATLAKADRAQDTLLLRELARAIPHGGKSDDVVRELRRDSQTLAETNRRFEPLRAEIHGQPSAATLGRVEAWARINTGLPTEQKALLARVQAQLTALYSPEQTRQRLGRLAGSLGTKLNDIAVILRSDAPALDRTADALALSYEKFQTATPADALRLLDLMTALEADALSAARALPAPENRAEALRRAALLTDAAYHLGYLSESEARRVASPLRALNGDRAGTPRYAAAVQRLQLVPAWAQTHVRYVFAEPLAKYTALDTRAAKFTDDLLRGSILQPLTEITEILSRDVGQLSGISASIMGETRSALALNPGRAQGRLRVVEPGPDGSLPAYASTDIVIIPSTIAELFPAAGIITVGEGNPLSHVQILARNLGIPNVVVSADLQSELAAYEGQSVELAATADGRVLLRRADDYKLPAAKADTPSSIGKTGTVPAPQPNLARIAPVPLSELQASLSGKIVGPKAANVGELARLFPDRVAPAVALPFGAFAAHVEAPRAALARSFQDYRAGRITEDAFLIALDTARDRVKATPVNAATRAALTEQLKAFDRSTGLFIRSDTNMEDLPQFTGAGLNLTLPNVTGDKNIFDGIPEVWSSVYTRRAMAWRSQVLSNPEDVFSSVLLMQSVPSEKSGVLVTTDLSGQNRPNSLTVSVAYGVGGAVDGESAASYLLTPRQDIVLAEAKAPFQRYLKPEGGVGWRPASSGDILTTAETAELRNLAAEVVARYPVSLGPDGKPLPFDIEFGFAGGKLYLLQIRPLVQRGAALAETVVGAVLPKPVGTKSVLLSAPLNKE